MAQNLNNRIIHYATRPNPGMYLFLFAMIEAAFFPVPPDVLLIPLAIMYPHKAFMFALVATAGSVFGGILSYVVGSIIYAAIGAWAIEFYNLTDKFNSLRDFYHAYDFYIISMAGFSPLPYKLITFFSGFMATDIGEFITASSLSRGARFFLIAWLLWRFGPSFKGWIETNFYPLTMVASVAMMLGIVLLQYLMQG